MDMTSVNKSSYIEPDDNAKANSCLSKELTDVPYAIHLSNY